MDPCHGGPDWMKITPVAGFLFHEKEQNAPLEERTIGGQGLIAGGPAERIEYSINVSRSDIGELALELAKVALVVDAGVRAYDDLAKVFRNRPFHW